MIPYEIDGFSADYVHLSDPNGPDNAMSIRVNFRLTISGEVLPVEVRAKLVVASNPFDRLIEVYAPELPGGRSIKADELQDAIRRYLFAFLNTDEAIAEFRKCGTFSESTQTAQ